MPIGYVSFFKFKTTHKEVETDEQLCFEIKLMQRR